MTEKILGIDLGTTNSEVALYENGTMTIIEGPDGKMLPSYVGLDDSDNLLVGGPAMNQFVLYPEKTIKSIKRLMGQTSPVPLGESSYLPQEISAMILRHLKNIAETSLGYPVHKAVITVPAFFSDSQRQATREAGQMAGLEVVKIINEPTAATLVYESNHKGAKRVLVYDLGGGTFDVSVVELQDDVIEVIASHGNNNLGGDDFDALIEKLLMTQIEEDGFSDISRQAQARIRRAAENAKKQLSNQPFALIEEEYLSERDGIPYNLSVELARHEYEEMITPLLDETLDSVHLVLKDAGLTSSGIDEILLVGGSTRTPLLQQRLEKVFGKAPRFELDPDLCVAAGAALQAAMISGEEIRAVLVDVTPYTFGTSAIGEIDGEFSLNMFVPVIKKNSPIPVTRSELFYTAADFQHTVEIKVYQGEAKNALENIEVGSFLVEGLSELPSKNEIIAKFSLDSNGILQVSAIEKVTGLEKSITIDNVITDENRDSLDQARDKIRQLFGEEEQENYTAESIETGDSTSKNVGNSRKVQAEALIDKARSLFDTAGDDDREDMIDLIENIDQALVDDNENLLLELMEELSEIIFYMES
ncbi:MAG: Hsp70 family protein [Desulfobulbaceae bacterium]|nr:Hsp70 family protein [Desulfobulbaceae bacterium]